MSNPNPNTTKMLEYAKMRTEQAVTKAEAAISQMLNDNVAVNFNSVSVYSGVSKRFLYSHADIKEKIINLRSQPNPSNVRTKVSLNESSKDVIISRQKLRIQCLTEEISGLKKELQILYGKLASYQTK